jgi:hypothetical protein
MVYDEAGNLVELKVQRSGTCSVGTSSFCAQRYRYDSDPHRPCFTGRIRAAPKKQAIRSDPHRPCFTGGIRAAPKKPRSSDPERP